MAGWMAACPPATDEHDGHDRHDGLHDMHSMFPPINYTLPQHPSSYHVPLLSPTSPDDEEEAIVSPERLPPATVSPFTLRL